MKRIFCVAALLCAGLFSQAQSALTNTKWSGIANIPSPETVDLVFGKDTLNLVYNEDAIETMSYSVKDNKLTITKLSGMSPCSGETAVYKFTIKDEKLVLEAETDGCDARSAAFSPDGYKMVKK